MVRDNILEFERRHSQNLIELNEWVRKTEENSKREPISGKTREEIESEIDDTLKPSFIEDSTLYKETGKLKDCDPLYKRINSNNFEDASHLKMLSAYLTDEELKERLVYENYMLLETEKVIDLYLTHNRAKKIKQDLKELMKQVKTLENSLKKPTMKYEENEEDELDNILLQMEEDEEGGDCE